MFVAALIVLTKPLPPAADKVVCIIVFVVQLIAHPLGIPDQHIIIDLHTLRIKHNTGKPVRQPVTCKHLMEEPLMEFSLALNILNEKHLEEVCLQVYVDKSWSHLDNGEVEHEYWPKDREVEVVVNISKAIVLFILYRFYDLFVDILFKSVDVLVSVLE